MRRSVRRLGLGVGVLGLLLGLGWGLGWGLGPTPSEQASPAVPRPPRPEPSNWSAQALAAASAVHGTQTLGGRVLGPEGPLEGVLVVALAPPSAAWRAQLGAPVRGWRGCAQNPDVSRLGEWVEAHRDEGLPLARATTDAQGRFLLEGLAPGAVVLWAEKGPWVGLREGVSTGPQEEDVHVGLGKVLSGDVRDEQRRPLAGVRVTTWVLAAGRFLETLTDAEGRFALGPLPEPDEPLLLSREGFVTELDSPPAGRGWWSPLSLPLRVERRVSGQVLDERGPVAGATVRSENLPDSEAGSTDERGRFSLQELCGTSHVLVARQGERVARQRVDWMTPGEHAPVELFLTPGVRLSGRVRDTSGHALAQAEVTVFVQGRPNQVVGVEKTDTRGRFLFEPLVPGRYGVSAQAPDYSLQRLPPRLLTSPQEVELELKPAERVEGVVVDEGGSPVEQAQVRVLGPRGRGLDGSQVSSGEGGHFTLELPPPGDWRLEIQHPEFVREEVALPASVRDVRVVLRRGASLEVEVVDEAGRPVEHAGVALSESQRGTTDARGRVAFRALGAGTYDVLACVVDTGRIASQQQPLTAQDSRTVRLVPRRSEGRLSGRAVDTRGAPVEGVSLSLGPEDLQRATRCSVPLEVRPGPDGSFSLEHLAEGTWTLAASEGFELDVAASRGVKSWRGRATRVQVSSAGTEVQLVFRLRGERQLRGRVLREDGAPVTSFQLNDEQVSHPEGRFSLSSFPEGRLRLRLEAPGLVPRILWATWGPGEQQVDLGDVVLQRSVSLTGTVVDALSSAPLSQVQVGFKDKAAQRYLYPEVYTRPDGHFTLEGLPAEDGTLVLTHPLYPSPQLVPVTPGQREAVVRLVPGATLEGRVELEGVPVPAGTVQLSTAQGGLVATTEFVKGHYTLELIPAGRYAVRVQGPRGSGPAVLVSLITVELAAGERKTLDFAGPVAGASVDVLVSSKDIEVHLVPGELPLLGPRQGLYNRLLEGFMGKRVSDGVRHFSQLPAGNYTLIAIRHDDQGTDVHRDLVELSSGGEPLSFTLAPLWNHFED